MSVTAYNAVNMFWHYQIVYTVWVKIIDFSFMPKLIRILRSCSKNIFSKCPTVNISKLNFWLVICIAKNFIWTTLKMIFSIFRYFCTLRFQIYKYCPNHTSMESYLFKTLILMTGFVVQEHILNPHGLWKRELLLKMKLL